MNSLTVVGGNLPAVKAKGGAIAETVAELEGLKRTRAILFEHIRGLSFDTWDDPSGIAPARQAVERARGYVCSAEFAETETQLRRATEFAAEDLIGRELKLLLGSWPNTAKADLAAFGAMLAVDVRSTAPSRYAVMAACRQLRTTLKFLPTIAEVLEAIRDEEGHIQSVAEFHRSLPGRVERAAKQIAAWDQRQAQNEADRKRRLEEGKATDWS